MSKVLSLFLRRGGLYNGCFPKEWGSADINKVWEKLCFNVVQERLIVIVESVYPVFFFVWIVPFLNVFTTSQLVASRRTDALFI